LQERQLPDVEQPHVQHERPKHLQDSAVKHSLVTWSNSRRPRFCVARRCIVSSCWKAHRSEQCQHMPSTHARLAM
jgi:hypothetical protein